MESNYRYAALEGIARKVLKGYDTSLLTGEPRAVPIEDIIERYFGISVEYHCIRKNGVILGATVFESTLFPIYDAEQHQYGLIRVAGDTIILDESLLSGVSGRLRFTCAHELAHWLIHKELFSGSGQVPAMEAAQTSLEDSPLVERQADYLGSTLLLPHGQVKKAFYRCQSRDSRVLTENLASLFDVSKQTMRIFLESHRMI